MSSGMRPFFNYYGGKWRSAFRYPAPRHETIVEPFAGSAGYATRYADRLVVLCEIDPVVFSVWQYLIKVKAAEVLAIPDIPEGGTVDDLNICQEARWLVGFWLNAGAPTPRKSPSKWMRSGTNPGAYWGTRVRQRIARQVDVIRHWRVYNCHYKDCPITTAATWFIDPPYESAGKHYRFGSAGIDYTALASWCKSRPGQVIVCENEGAGWLPFQSIGDVQTMRKGRRSKEAVWCNQ